MFRTNGETIGRFCFFKMCPSDVRPLTSNSLEGQTSNFSIQNPHITKQTGQEN